LMRKRSPKGTAMASILNGLGDARVIDLVPERTWEAAAALLVRDRLR
jgi:hypothetical protein